MAFVKDLEPYPFGGEWKDPLLAVGWLEREKAFSKGPVDEAFFIALVRLCMDPWQPLVTAGYEPCSLCRFSGGPGKVSCRGMNVPIGSANVFVPAPGRVFVAPTMIVHYVDAHEYLPPVEFQEAVVRCPEMRSMSYLKEMKGRRITAAR